MSEANEANEANGGTYSNLTFILGGARSGKSAQAEALARAYDRVLYVATAEVFDGEMEKRVAAHRQRRPQHWQTLEAPRQTGAAIAAFLAEQPVDCVLLDCLSIFTSNILLACPEDCAELDAWAAVQEELDDLLRCVAAHANIAWIVVSNEVGQGVVPAYPLGRLYRDVLGRTNQRLAAHAGAVRLMVAGIPLVVK